MNKIKTDRPSMIPGSKSMLNNMLPKGDILDEPLASACDLVYAPDDRLKVVCVSVEPDGFGEDLSSLASNMVARVVLSDGAGLAAPQAGDDRRIIVIWRKVEDDAIVMVNPEVVARSSGTFSWAEGCLSCPGLLVQRTRHRWVDVRFFDIDGEEQELRMIGRDAAAVDHEIEHLDGKTLMDAASPSALRRYKISRMTAKERTVFLKSERRKRNKKNRKAGKPTRKKRRNR